MKQTVFMAFSLAVFFFGLAIGYTIRRPIAETPYDLIMCGNMTMKMYFPYTVRPPKGCVATGTLEPPKN